MSELTKQLEKVWVNPPGWRALTIVNHTTVGIRFMVTGGVFFLIGGLLAMVMRSQLAFPQQDLVSPEIYNQLFTMHGSLMMFLFAVPILEGVALYLIPKMIGARDLAFPRLSAFGYFCYLFGGIILTFSLVLDMAPNAGWFMYTPLSSSAYSPGPNSDFWLLGITFVEISTVSAAVELVVSILRTRTAKMGLQHMPLFCWYILVASLMIVFGFPPLILASMLLEVERAAGLPFFDVARGGDPLLWQHLFWLFGHPEVYIIFLPAAGLVSTMLPVFARHPIVGYRWVVLGVITMGFVSFGLWVHHMFTVGIPHLAEAFFSAASMLVAVPTAIQIFAWLATLWAGRPVFGVPMLWILGFLVIFIMGGFTGVMVALVPFDWQVHDSHFVVAHMHYVLVGGMLFPLVAGLYYYLPHVSGRLPSGALSHWGFWLTFIGFNLTFLIMHFTGLMGMPRRVYTYDYNLGWDVPNLISSIGGFVMAMGVAATLLDLGLHFRVGRRLERPNPWNADSLEWAIEQPPTSYNFVTLPESPGRHPLWEHPDIARVLAEEKGLLNHPKPRLRETLGSDAVNGRVQEIVHLPGNSWWPFICAVVLAVVCIGLLTKFYWVAAIAALLTTALLLRWSWENGAHPKAAPDGDTGPGNPPLHSRTFSGPGVWGSGVTLLANGSFYVSLIFGWLYLWTVAPEWQVPGQTALGLLPMLIAGVILSLAWLVFQYLVRALRLHQDRYLGVGLWVSAGLGFLHSGFMVWVLLGSGLAPKDTAHDALITVILIYLLTHSSLCTVMTVLQALRVHWRYVSKDVPYEPVVVLQWWLYTTAVFWLSVLAIFATPWAWGKL